ncbi:M23 family metallopeptidase [Catellatospora sp. TT07R-123]|uniref:M23 family metallopeptidase n=1 Tax=Catellatospora sp. TT07R-123 TaxID=2733863 RepID=UPI001BB36D93
MAEGYRGRRRVSAPPRLRYATAVTTAFVGAGMVALTAGAAIPDAKPSGLTGDAGVSDRVALARAEAAGQASRGDERALSTSISQAPDAWVLPLHGYTLSSGFGMRWGAWHKGLDLAGMPEGTPYAAVHDGTVVQAGWNGGYGYSIMIDHGGGLQTLYGHSSRILVKEGQQVHAGDVIGRIGNTGQSFGTHLHLEIHVNGLAQNPMTWFARHGVDFATGVESVFGG